MKNLPGMFLKETHITSLLIFCLISIPNVFYGQTGEEEVKFEIILSCTEFIGDGKMVAHFGYENPSNKSIVIDETGSVVTYNYGQSKKYGINSFEPGLHEMAFSQEYDVKDRVEWTVKFPDGSEKVTDANINSNHCKDPWESLKIIPGYYPPEGGKEYGSKIGAELTSLYNYFISSKKFKGVTDDIFQIDGTRVLIEVVAVHEEGINRYVDMLEALDSPGIGFELETEDPLLIRATGWIEIGDLLELNRYDPPMDALLYARPVYPGVGNYIVPATGLTNSQGDFAMHSDFARLGYDIDGSDVKIGVLSNSYDTRNEADRDVRNGDLPGPGNINGFDTPVHVLKDITNGTLSDEGRAMLQIVHDIAPGAELAFRTGFLGEQDMADGIRALATAGCDIIVDDLSYITEPFFRDGVISQAINEVVGNGVTFFSSAGNFGSASFEADFSAYIPPTGEDTPGTIPGTAHAFDGVADIFQKILLPEGNYTLVMQWDDGSDATMTTTETDLDIFLSDDAGFSLLGFNRENVGGFPIEVVPFSVSGADVEANIVIARAVGDGDVHFKYILFRGASQFEWIDTYDGTGSSTIVGHPNAESAITVGAVRFDKNPVYSDPLVYPDPVIMSFSSMGGTPLFPLLTTSEVRDKPDITAPNGVNTTIDLGNGDWDDPIDPDTRYPNFFGTSAASPHAAGMAALIMQAQLEFDPDSEVTDMTPDGIRALMKSTTIENYDSDPYNYTHGSGFIQAHKALMTFANPTPYIKNLILAAESGSTSEGVTFTVKGDFFTEQTQILIRDVPLQQGVVFEDPSTINVTHPGFLGNPEVKAYTPDISPSGEDGGYSEGVYFSDPVKLDVIITATSYEKKYGEVTPGYEATIEVKTIDVYGDEIILTLADAESAGIVLPDEAARLSGLAFNEAAGTTWDAGQYIIVPSLSPELFTDSNLDEIDNAISAKYILEFVNGSLTIEKLALKITPMDVDMFYGETLPDVMSFSYELDSGANINDADVEYIVNLAEDEHTGALTNEIALVRGIALVNGIPMVRGIALVNGVTMIRGIALVNGVEVEVQENGTVLVAGEPVTSGATLIRGIALVNGLPFVNMTEIVRGIALVNGTEVNFEDGYMSLDDDPVANGIPVVRGVALVNEPGIRGIALVNGEDGPIEIIVEDGSTTINGDDVPLEGIAEINGIPTIRGIALVNSGNIIRGIALVNDLAVPIENGIPTVRGIALVNGIPMVRGIALVNDLEVHVDNGVVDQVFQNGDPISLSISRGIALVNDVALVNGTDLSDGPALVNGIALTDENGDGDGEDVVNLENMNLLASGTAITSGISTVRGIALVNGIEIEGIEGDALKIAAGTTLDDGSIIYENATPTSRGIALVNGGTYIRGVALVNTELGTIPVTSGTPIVNGSTSENNSFGGTILVFDATDIGTPAESVSFTPISFITGTTVGRHWIVPGTYISNNFEISYGLGNLTIDPAPLTITADINGKNYGENDPELTFSATGLVGSDGISGELSRVGAGQPWGEEVGSYEIIQGSLTAGPNYNITVTPGTLFYINPYGPGTRAIKPVLNCVVDQGDGTYLANFEYKNDNDADYYIPVGDNNTFVVAGDGIIEFYDSYPDMPRMSQPTLFKVGGGEFQVIFDAESEIRWTLTSVEKDQKTSNATSATSSSTKCTGNLKSASVDSDILGEELDSDLLLVYPVPVVDKLHITMKDIENYKMIMLYDFAGRSVPVRSIEKRSDMLEIDMAELASGPYFIRIVMEETTRTVTLLKQ